MKMMLKTHQWARLRLFCVALYHTILYVYSLVMHMHMYRYAVMSDYHQGEYLLHVMPYNLVDNKDRNYVMINSSGYDSSSLVESLSSLLSFSLNL